MSTRVLSQFCGASLLLGLTYGSVKCMRFKAMAKSKGKTNEEMEKEYKEWQKLFPGEFDVPDRKAAFEYPPNEEIKWRTGKPPNYVKTDYAFIKGKIMNHPKGSLERVVEDLVKRWEMELTHKTVLKQWSTVDDGYVVSVNGNEAVSGEEVNVVGNYNALTKSECPVTYQRLITDQFPDTPDQFEKTHLIFRKAFLSGFPWEVIKVLSPPPEVVFLWRHWADFDGEFMNKEGKGRRVEMYGMTKAKLNDAGKIERLEVYFDPESFLKDLNQEIPQEGEAAPKKHWVRFPLSALMPTMKNDGNQMTWLEKRLKDLNVDGKDKNGHT